MQAVKDKINEMGAMKKVKEEARAEERVRILQHFIQIVLHWYVCRLHSIRNIERLNHISLDSTKNIFRCLIFYLVIFIVQYYHYENTHKYEVTCTFIHQYINVPMNVHEYAWSVLLRTFRVRNQTTIIRFQPNTHFYIAGFKLYITRLRRK